MNHQQWRKAGAKAILSVVAISLATAFLERATLAQKTLTYSQFIQEVKSGKIERVGVNADRSQALVHAKDGTKANVQLSPKDNQLIDTLTKYAVEIYAIYEGNRNRSTQTNQSQTNLDPDRKTLKYSQFIQEVKSGKIARVGFNADRSQANVQTKDGNDVTVNIPANDTQLVDLLTENAVEIYILPPDGEPNRSTQPKSDRTNPSKL